MKQLIIGLFLGIFGSLAVVWISGSSNTNEDSANCVSSAQLMNPPASPTSPLEGGPKPNLSTSQNTPAPHPTAPNSVTAASLTTPVAPRPMETPTPQAPMPQLFTGNVEGFPKLDEKTKKVLDRVQQKVSANQPEAALEDLENAYRAEPNNAYYAVELAMMNNDILKNSRRTEEVLTEYLRRDPSSKMVSAAYADYLSQQGREKEAGTYYSVAASGADAPLEAKTQEAHHYMRTAEFGKAVEVYRGAYELAARDVQEKASKGESVLFAKQRLGFAALDSAVALLKAGDPGQARRMASEAGQLLGPEHPDVKRYYETERAIPKSQKGLSE